MAKTTNLKKEKPLITQKHHEFYWMVLIVLVVVLSYLYAAYFPNSPSALKSVFFIPSQSSVLANSLSNSNFLTYTDPSMGYQIPYPKGYLETYAPDAGIDVSFSASYSGTTSEIIYVSSDTQDTLNSVYESQMYSNFTDFSNVTSAKNTQVNGYSAYEVGGKFPNPFTNEQMIYKQTIISCPANSNRNSYLAVVFGLFPQTLSSDLAYYNYAINNFKC